MIYYNAGRSLGFLDQLQSDGSWPSWLAHSWMEWLWKTYKLLGVLVRSLPLLLDYNWKKSQRGDSSEIKEMLPTLITDVWALSDSGCDVDWERWCITCLQLVWAIYQIYMQQYLVVFEVIMVKCMLINQDVMYVAYPSSDQALYFS